MLIFKYVKFVEHLGSCVKRILEKYDESVFNITSNFMRVRFMFEGLEGDQEEPKKRPIRN
jgi:hypothetical protein